MSAGVTTVGELKSASTLSSESRYKTLHKKIPNRQPSETSEMRVRTTNIRVYLAAVVERPLKDGRTAIKKRSDRQ